MYCLFLLLSFLHIHRSKKSEVAECLKKKTKRQHVFPQMNKKTNIYIYLSKYFLMGYFYSDLHLTKQKQKIINKKRVGRRGIHIQ